MKVLLYQVRKERNLTLRQVADLTNISYSTLNRFENGLNSPTLDQLEQIAKALSVSINDLFDSPFK